MSQAKKKPSPNKLHKIERKQIQKMHRVIIAIDEAIDDAQEDIRVSLRSSSFAAEDLQGAMRNHPTLIYLRELRKQAVAGLKDLKKKRATEPR